MPTDLDPATPALSRPFWLVFGVFVVAMLGTTLPTPLYPLYQVRFGFSSGTVTVIFAAYALAVVAGLVLVGRVSDEVGRRPVLVAGLAMAVASDGCFVAGGGLGALLAGRVFSGLCAGAFAGTATAMLVDLAPHRRRLAAMLAVAANLGGLGLGPLVAGAFAEWGGEPLRAPYILHLLLAGAAIGCIVAVPETVVDRRWRLRLNRLGVPADVRGVFVPAAVAGFCCFAAAGLFSSIAPEFLARVLHRPDHLLAGAVTALMFLTSVAGQVAVGRMPAGRALAGGCVALLAGVGAIAAALVGASLAVLVAAAVLVGLGQGVIVGAGLAAISLRTAAGLRGQVSSTFFVVSYVGLALPVIGVGEAADRIGLRTAGLGFAAAVAVVVAAVLVALAARAGAGAQTAG